MIYKQCCGHPKTDSAAGNIFKAIMSKIPQITTTGYHARFSTVGVLANYQ